MIERSNRLNSNILACFASSSASDRTRERKRRSVNATFLPLPLLLLFLYSISRLDSSFDFLLKFLFIHSRQVISLSQKGTRLRRKMAVSHLLSSTIIILNVSWLSSPANDDNTCNWTEEVKRERERETAAAVQQCIHMFDVSRCVRNMDILIITIWREGEWSNGVLLIKAKSRISSLYQGYVSFSFSFAPFQSSTISWTEMKDEWIDERTNERIFEVLRRWWYSRV